MKCNSCKYKKTIKGIKQFYELDKDDQKEILNLIYFKKRYQEMKKRKEQEDE